MLTRVGGALKLWAEIPKDVVNVVIVGSKVYNVKENRRIEWNPNFPKLRVKLTPSSAHWNKI